MKDDPTSLDGQLSLFEDFWRFLQESEGSVTAAEVTQTLKRMRSEQRERENQSVRGNAANGSVASPDSRMQQEALERQREAQRVQEITSMELPLDWENAFFDDPRTRDVFAESISDGLVLSLTNLGCVDIEYIASITGEDCKTVICALKGSIYQNPDTWNECFYKGWETAEEYLSGNLMRKLRRARKANAAYSGYFEDNIRALERVLPPAVAAKDIYITLGSPWVPVDIIDDFINHILKLSRHNACGTLHDEHTGTWELQKKNDYPFCHRVESYLTYGTTRIDALHILERTLNMKSVAVTDSIPCLTTKSGTKRVLNKSETVLALEKQQKQIEEFRSWVWKDPKRKQRLETIFESKFSCVRRRLYDGSFLQFPTMSPKVQLYPYQKNAVARILFSPNTLLAHDVGSGKTYIMTVAGMELRRMGLSKRNLYVVPNNIVAQWRQIFTEVYPDAKLLCVEPKGFTPSKRQGVLKRIREEDFDGIIMAYSCFDLIPISKTFRIQQLKDERDEVSALIGQNKKATSKLRRRLEAIEKELTALTLAEDWDGICFDELGITRLFVDEAHNYKNVPIETKTSRVLGISSAGSKKCRDMMDKVHTVQKLNRGGGVVMATGTPITNSITDAYVMQLYLQSGELSLLDLQSFDSWIGMFAERVTEFEIDVDTSGYRLATRFSKFHNLPELTAMLASVADFHQVDASMGVPEVDDRTDALLGKTEAFAAYLKLISQRAESVRKGAVSRTEDNMLKITTDGRKAALDIRLVDPKEAFTYQSKVARCAENVLDIYRKTRETQSTQLIFCDTSTPKEGFNLYDELKRLLIAMGIPRGEIAFVHDAETESKRERLFANVRNGTVRVLIGSTFKLGLGVNVQDRLIALHHLDVPWRPADMTQREGRILRQGNQNKSVRIFRYITEGSFDAYSWQLLETKQRFITGLLSGSMSERSGSDIEGTVLDYAEVKALAIGNPLIKERVETANELTRQMALHRKAVEERLQLEAEQLEMPARIQHQENVIRACEADGRYYAAAVRDYDKEERKALRKRLFAALKENVLSGTERFFAEYQGFRILLPANMSEQKPFVWLQREGRYVVEMGDSEVGCLIRLDNFLSQLPEYLVKRQERLEELLSQQETIRLSLEKKESYTDAIAALQQRLDEIDKELGVNQS